LAGPNDPRDLQTFFVRETEKPYCSIWRRRAQLSSARLSLLLPVTAGGFVYLAAADLTPELQEDRSLGALAAQMSLMSAGMVLMAALTLID